MIPARIVLFMISFMTWLLLSWSIDMEHLFVGAILGVIVSMLTSDIFAKKIDLLRHLSRYIWFLYYIPVFAWECIKANLDGAYRVIHPDLPIRPGIVKVKTSLKSHIGLAFLANSITLKPGTMTIDIDEENGFLYVHCSQVRVQDVEGATRDIVQRFERILKRIFE